MWGLQKCQKNVHLIGSKSTHLCKAQQSWYYGLSVALAVCSNSAIKEACQVSHGSHSSYWITMMMTCQRIKQEWSNRL
jgi:hypothetical protein